MKLARVALLLTIFSLLFLNPVLPQSNNDEEDDEDTGGVYPTEYQGGGTNTIDPNREELGSYGSLPKSDFTQQLHISSQTQDEIRPNYFVLEGYVDITHQGIRLQSDRAEYDTVTKHLIATGNVVLDQEGQRISGEKLEMNMEDQTGTMYNVFGYVPPQFFFWGTKLEKLGEDEYKIYDGVFTECSQIVPHWQLKTTTTRLTFNEYAHFRNFTLKAKKVPIFYSPYMMWPIKRDRATGFLFPGFGPNDNKGFWVGGSFFWAMGRSMDSTYWLDHWALRGWAGGAEYRYATGEKSGGSARYYYADDQELGPQWTLSGQVKQDLPWDFRFAAVADVFSSFEYIADSDNSFAGSARRQQRAQGFLTRNWSYYSLNVLGDFSETQFQRTREVQLFHLPEVELQARSQEIGPTGLFWTFTGSVSHLGRTDVVGPNDLDIRYQRYDMFPGISYPMTQLSWLTVTPGFGYRVTHYTRSQLEPTGSRDVPVTVDEAFTRNYMDLSIDVRGPNFAKIFDTPNWGYSKKWKHAIEPQITYRYIQDIEDLLRILRIDDVDEAFGLNVVTYGITNLLYSKRPIKEPEHYDPDEYQYYNPQPYGEDIESPWELISWRISQSYSMQSDRFDVENFPLLRPFSPISSDLRVNPSANYNIDFRVDYDMYERQITNINVGSTLRDEERWYANITYNYSNQVRITGIRTRADAHQIRTNGGFGILKNRFVFTGEFDYDFIEKKVYRNSAGVLYNDDCFTIGVEWRRFDFGDNSFRRDENQLTFTVSLPNLGSLVDFRSGTPPRRF
jgi:LPS-assembly protein